MRTLLTAAKLWDGDRLLEHPVVTIQDGQIASISTNEAADKPSPSGNDVLVIFPARPWLPHTSMFIFMARQAMT